VLGWLDILTAEYALPILRTERPTDATPDRLLKIARGVVQGKRSREAAQKSADNSWEWLNSAYYRKNQSISDSAACAYAALIFSVFSAAGNDAFMRVDIQETDEDIDIDFESCDVAAVVAQAITGGLRPPGPDSATRLEYWTWWLTQAIPAAGEQAYA